MLFLFNCAGFTGFTRLPRGFRPGFISALWFYTFVGKKGILTCLPYLSCHALAVSLELMEVAVSLDSLASP